VKLNPKIELPTQVIVGVSIVSVLHSDFGSQISRSIPVYSDPIGSIGLLYCGVVFGVHGQLPGLVYPTVSLVLYLVQVTTSVVPRQVLVCQLSKEFFMSFGTRFLFGATYIFFVSVTLLPA
jgi:hypothetical protein